MSAEFINVFQNDTLQNCQRNYINIFNPRISLKFREASVNQHAKHASHQFLTRVLQNIDEGILQFEEDLQDLVAERVVGLHAPKDPPSAEHSHHLQQPDPANDLHMYYSSRPLWERTNKASLLFLLMTFSNPCYTCTLLKDTLTTRIKIHICIREPSSRPKTSIV